MQTAIHFEGDQAYICVSDHGKIKEEDPVSYGRSRVEFVIQTAKAQEEGKIAVVFDDATGKIVKDAEEQCIRSGLQQGQVNFFTKEEAALGVVLFRGDNLAKGNTGIFDYTRKHFVYYEVKKQKDSVIVEAKDYTEQIKHAVTDQEKDAAFLTIIKQALARGIKRRSIYVEKDLMETGLVSQPMLFVSEDECLWENISLHLERRICVQTDRENKKFRQP